MRVRKEEGAEDVKERDQVKVGGVEAIVRESHTIPNF